ncbi:MAG: hypothetical protein MUO67_14900 [Anaerolineales bacterium]|nr:hypothetical protein [Anaerolineales bacterium]
MGYTHALWEGGSAAFNQLDEWSDIDLHLVVDDEHVNDAFNVVDRALETLSPIELKYELPQPTWHGHAQAFYRLEHGGRFMIVYMVVMQLSHPDKYLETELHGQAMVHFDKSAVVQPPMFDWDAHQLLLKERLATLDETFDLFQFLTLKEINRGNDLEAVSFYYSFTLNPLVEVLRIKHTPARYNFSTRHIHYDLPAEVLNELRELFFVVDVDDLHANGNAQRHGSSKPSMNCAPNPEPDNAYKRTLSTHDLDQIYIQTLTHWNDLRLCLTGVTIYSLSAAGSFIYPR